MSALTIAYAALFYAATAIFAVGVALKIAQYARVPAPLKIPTTPAPMTRGGVVWRMLREVALFESLYRANKWIWLFGWLFHVALALVLARHLRYFQEPVWGAIEIAQPFGVYAGFAMLAGLAGLWARRFLVERMRYISTWSDHLMLALLVAIAVSGLAMKYVAHTDIVRVKAFMLGLMAFDWQPLRRSGAAPAPRAGGGIDGDLPGLQAVACTRGLFQPDAQSGGRLARATPPDGVGGEVGDPWPPRTSRHRRSGNTPSSRSSRGTR
jgi:nitrate reductase gamma subunit